MEWQDVDNHKAKRLCQDSARNKQLPVSCKLAWYGQSYLVMRRNEPQVYTYVINLFV